MTKQAEDREYWHETLAEAIADANRWNGRACVVPADDRFRVLGGAMSFALYVTIGCRYGDWEKEALARRQATRVVNGVTLYRVFNEAGKPVWVTIPENE